MSALNPLSGERAELQEDLKSLPDQVASFLFVWRQKTLEREKKEALLSLRFKVENPSRMATEIKAMVHADDERFKVCLDEARAEAQYTKVYEILMAAKRLAGIREAF